MLKYERWYPTEVLKTDDDTSDDTFKCNKINFSIFKKINMWLLMNTLLFSHFQEVLSSFMQNKNSVWFLFIQPEVLKHTENNLHGGQAL